jgi:hypothetical protein
LGAPLDYDEWPLYRALAGARAAGRVRPFCVGVGLDALTLTATILTVVVFDDDVFDELFGAAVDANAEGVFLGAASGSKRVPFTERWVARLTAEEPMASPAASILAKAHACRETLLS